MQRTRCLRWREDHCATGVVDEDGEWLEPYEDIQKSNPRDVAHEPRHLQQCLKKRTICGVRIHDRREPEENLRHDAPEMRNVFEAQRERRKHHPDSQCKQCHLDENEQHGEPRPSKSDVEHQREEQENAEVRQEDDEVCPANGKNEEDPRKPQFLNDGFLIMQHRHAAHRGMRKMFPQNDAEEEVERIIRNGIAHEGTEDIEDDQKFHERRRQRPQVSKKRSAIFQHKIRPAHGEDNAERVCDREWTGHGTSLNDQ